MFDGKIVISGGYSSEYEYSKSVEAYDHYENKWTYLPDMQFRRWGHSAVSKSNKMFIIKGISKEYSLLPCEVYDKVSNKFSFIGPPAIHIRHVVEQPYCVGNKIALITGWYENRVSFSVYDIDENSWSNQVKHFF